MYPLKQFSSYFTSVGIHMDSPSICSRGRERSIRRSETFYNRLGGKAGVNWRTKSVAKSKSMSSITAGVLAESVMLLARIDAAVVSLGF
jgi:hypothetical protein